MSSTRALEHGTNKGYYRHLHRREPACDACKAAHREAQRRQRAARRAQKKKLAADQHVPEEYRSPAPPFLIGDAEIGDPIPGADLQIGDLVVHLGRRHRVLRLEPYWGSLRPLLGGAAARTAVCEDGFELPFGPESIVRIAPREESA